MTGSQSSVTTEAATSPTAALDHTPRRSAPLAVLDSIPIVEGLERADARFAEAWWQWFFFASPQAERAITADPLA